MTQIKVYPYYNLFSRLKLTWNTVVHVRDKKDICIMIGLFLRPVTNIIFLNT